jgi:hypothetical protein
MLLILKLVSSCTHLVLRHQHVVAGARRGCAWLLDRCLGGGGRLPPLPRLLRPRCSDRLPSCRLVPLLPPLCRRQAKHYHHGALCVSRPPSCQALWHADLQNLAIIAIAVDRGRVPILEPLTARDGDAAWGATGGARVRPAGFAVRSAWTTLGCCCGGLVASAAVASRFCCRRDCGARGDAGAAAALAAAPAAALPAAHASCCR